VETWKCRRRRSCALLVTARRKLRASSYCVVAQFAKKAALSCFFSPYVCNAVNNGAHEQ